MTALQNQLGDQQMEIAKQKRELTEARAMQSKDEAIKFLQDKYQTETAQLKRENEKLLRDNFKYADEKVKDTKFFNDAKDNAIADKNRLRLELEGMERVADEND